MNPSPQPFPPFVEDTKFYNGGYAIPPSTDAPSIWEVTPEVTNPLRQTLGLVTPEELAAALGVKEETLTVWRCANSGPGYIKLGKRVFYRLQDLDFWVGTRFPSNLRLNPAPLEPLVPVQPLVPVEGLAGVDDADEESSTQEDPQVELPFAGN